ncbi:MAG: serpin family protein [Clostridia bacterium]|nr:serpin family protein [Clostridia bacterium]
MRFKKWIVLILAGLMLFSCASKEDRTEDADDTSEAAVGTDVVTAIPLAAAHTEPSPREADDTLRDAVISFSETFYRTLEADRDGNAVYSPLSLYYALALTSNGALGDTKEALEKALGIGTDELNAYLYALTSKLGETGSSTVKISNAFWGNADNFEVSPDFKTVARKYYDAEASSLSFSDPATLAAINDWVSQKTDGMIPTLFDSLDPGMIMALVNTVLFDGVWEEEYEERDIFEDRFTVGPGSVSLAEYLFSKEYSYFTTTGGVGFSKAYKDGYRFIAVLPDGDVGDFAAKMDLTDIIKKSGESRAECEAYIPKFEFETARTLNDVAEQLGAGRALTEDAELGGLSADGVNDIMISTILQKAKIILNEHGTKAAAATGITFGTTALPEPVPEVFLNRPFFFVIVDTDGIPLFLGTVENPAE